MIRVLHVIPSLALQTGGPAVLLTELVTALSAHSTVNTVITTNALTPAQARKPLAGASISDFPAGSEALDIQVYPLKRPFRFAYAPELKHAIVEQVGSVDLVHIHSVNLYPQYAAWKAASSSDVPYVVTPHGALDPWIRGKRRFLKQANDLLWQRRMLNGASALHLTADDERTLIEPMQIRSPHVVVPNGMHVAKFAQPGVGDVFRHQWLDDYAGPLILNHGRLSKKKGLDVLVEALARLQDNGEVRLALIGADDEGIGDALRSHTKRLGLEHVLHLVPPLSGHHLLNAIAAADVWALPSHSENFGLAVVEAMAAGKPVIASPHVNVAPDAAAADALIMVPNTPAYVAAAIQSLLENPKHRDQLGRVAADYVWRYDWSNVVQEFIALYESVIKRHTLKARA